LQASKLASEIRKGDRRALSKGITLAENDPARASSVLKLLRPPQHAFVVGVTGPPGTGKSTLVDRLVAIYRSKGLKVGVIAVDPTSPITGGALLGDRIRMIDHSGDRGVFIRSMASRGWSGGLSRAASQALQLLDAAGFDLVFLETVGIGQSDIEVVGVSHAVLVVLMPGLGDDVQVSKAGLMEVGDVYVVNKSDLEGADLMALSLLGMVREMKGRSPSVLKVSALSGRDLDKVVDAIDLARSRFGEGASELRLKSIRGMIVETARGDAVQRVAAAPEHQLQALARKVLAGELTVGEAASALVRPRATSSRGGRTRVPPAPRRWRQA
jgi:GTPase